MNKLQKNIIKEYLNLNIDDSHLYEIIKKGDLENFISNELLTIQQLNDFVNLQLILNFGIRTKTFNKDHVSILCKILNSSWHDYHETIISILEDINSPEAIEHLYNIVLNYKNKLLKYDDSFSLERNCIYAISKIKSNESLKKLNEIANIEEKTLATLAIKQLEKLK